MEEISAYHESGHAIMAYCVGAQVRHLSLLPEETNRTAEVEIAWPWKTPTNKPQCIKMIQVALGGPVAEMIYTGDSYHPGWVLEWRQDWKLAWQLGEPIRSNPEARMKCLEEITRDVFCFLHQDSLWNLVAAVADHLEAYEVLERDEFEDIVRNAPRY